MKQIILALLESKRSLSTDLLLTEIAQGFSEHADNLQREFPDKPQYHRYYKDLATRLFEIRNEFRKKTI